MTAPHSIHRVFNDMEKNPHGWPYALVVRDILGREVAYFGFNDKPGMEECCLEWAESRREEADWAASLPVGKRKGTWLEAARTVRSRAVDALSWVERDDRGYPRVDKYTGEELDIITDLKAVVSRLDNWQRTGRTPKYPGGSRHV